MRAGGELGAAAAELAVALPVVVLTIMLGLGALGAASTQVSLQDAASDAARLLARGEAAARVREAIAASAPGADMTTQRRDGLVCTTLRRAVRAGPISVPLAAQACALDGGW